MTEKEKEGSTGFVPVVFARDEEEAAELSQLLDDHDIETIVGFDEWEGGKADRYGRGVPVLVPESFLDEASEIIAERENQDEFAPLDDEEEEDDEEDDEDGFTLEEEGETFFEPDEEDDDVYEEEEEDDFEEDDEY